MVCVDTRSSSNCVMVCSGSSTKLPEFAGSMRRIEENGYTITEGFGCSGGSAVLGIKAAGMETDCIKDTLMAINFGDIIKIDIWRVLKNIAFHQDIVIDRGKKYFDMLLKLTNGIRCRDTKFPFTCTASDLKGRKCVLLGTKHTPDELLATVIYCSSTIPYGFSQKSINGVWLADGGMYKNFPVDLVPNDGRMVFGHLIDSDEPPSRDGKWWFGTASLLLDNLLDFNVNTSIEIAKKELGDKFRFIETDGLNIGTLDFNISHEKKVALYEQGYKESSKLIEEV